MILLIITMGHAGLLTRETIRNSTPLRSKKRKRKRDGFGIFPAKRVQIACEHQGSQYHLTLDLSKDGEKRCEAQSRGI